MFNGSHSSIYYNLKKKKTFSQNETESKICENSIDLKFEWAYTLYDVDL